MSQQLKRICVISGAAPNTNDAVGDFAWLLAKELSNYFDISFIIPGISDAYATVIDGKIAIYRVTKEWGIETSKQIQPIVKEIHPDVLLVHFVPQLYGWMGAKPFFTLLLHTLNQSKVPIVTIAHEFSSPFGKSPKMFLLASVHRFL